MLIQQNDKLLPEKVTDVSSSGIQGDYFVVSTCQESYILIKQSYNYNVDLKLKKEWFIYSS